MAIEDPIIIHPDGKFIPCYFSGGADETANVYSTVTQNPTEQDTPYQLQFDTSYTGTSFDVADNGILTVKQPGYFDIRLSLSLGRTASNGTSVVALRSELNPGGATDPGFVVFSPHRVFELVDNKAIVPTLFTSVATFTSIGVFKPKLRLVIARDSSGTNDGGVEAVATNTWGTAASASLYVSHYAAY
jgi:hypothetical protein